MATLFSRRISGMLRISCLGLVAHVWLHASSYAFRSFGFESLFRTSLVQKIYISKDRTWVFWFGSFRGVLRLNQQFGL